VPLRSPEIVGMTDPRDLTRPPQRASKSVPAPRKGPQGVQADAETSTSLQGALDSALNGEGAPSAARKKPAGDANSSAQPIASPRGASTDQPGGENRADATPVPADEERAFVQILVPPELAVRVGRASHYLKLEIYKARFQQTIMGALIDQSIPDPSDPAVISGMATMIARWRRDPLSERRASRRLGWHLPLTISSRLDELILNLKEQHYRLRPSATALVSALIWFELDPDSPQGQAALRELVIRHYDAYERPDYRLAAA
jgi:hypothetical protein